VVAARSAALRRRVFGDAVRPGGVRRRCARRAMPTRVKSQAVRFRHLDARDRPVAREKLRPLLGTSAGVSSIARAPEPPKVFYERTVGPIAVRHRRPRLERWSR
jgi:hypothetical protein